MTPEDGESGYTLLETLVAFAILAAAIITSFDIFNSGLRRMSATEESTSLADVARAELDRAALRPALSESTIMGKTGNVPWEIAISPVALESGQQLTEIFPFKLQFRRLSEVGSATPETILETIVLNRRAAP